MSNITEEYHKLLEEILKNGKNKSDRTGTGTKSIFSYQIKADMQDGFPLITTKRLHTRSIVHELLWFLQGDTNTKYLNENGVTIWDEWANSEGELGPVYGKMWRDWDEDTGTNIDQIQNAIDTLNNNPDSRRIIVSAWNPTYIPRMALPPCHWAFELYTEELSLEERIKLLEGTDIVFTASTITHELLDITSLPKRRIHLKWHQRSCDVFLGIPFNIASYAMLLHMFAQQTNMVPGTLIGDLTNVHIYDNHIEYVEKQLERDPNKYDLPYLRLNNNGSMFDYRFEDFSIEDYEYYPNWKNVPIAV